ncbi:uncharacterized protein LOC110719228 [Chenopodium quinoa]|uniref:uncharacterized protein LOC110719228 n=1 Tax=Chenopodium quinoa TaxID=63459 RepID=UPI000B78CEFA|nr:uncharacterized protein LOC110719228 [Chenopodium quinoa]
MALSMKQMAILIAFFGVVSLICGIIAESKKPAAGTPIAGKGVVICKYPSDPTVALGYTSLATLVITTAIGFKSIFHPYDNKAVPTHAVFGSKVMTVFFSITWLIVGLAATLLVWPTISQQLHLSHTVHHTPHYACPTAKTGLMGGGAFMSLNSALFWLLCLMLAKNAREDYFEGSSRV